MEQTKTARRRLNLLMFRVVRDSWHFIGDFGRSGHSTAERSTMTGAKIRGQRKRRVDAAETWRKTCSNARIWGGKSTEDFRLRALDASET